MSEKPDPLEAVRAAGRAAGEAAPPLTPEQEQRLRVLVFGYRTSA